MKFTIAQDQAILECYSPPCKAGEVKALMKLLGIDYNTLRNRLHQLGGSTKSRGDTINTRWSMDEITIIKEYSHLTSKKLVEIFASKGYNRTINGIDLFRRKLGWLSSVERDDEVVGYSTFQVAELLSVHHSSVNRWIRIGLLKTIHKGFHLEEKYRIHRKHLKDFMLGNPGYWNPCKVDKYWMMDILK